MVQRRLLPILLALTVPTLLALGVAVALMQWHKSTRVELELLVDRLALTVASDRQQEGFTTMVGPGNLRALRAHRVGRVAFRPRGLEIVDEARFDLRANRFPDDAWRPLALKDEVVLEPSSPAAGAVTLQSAESARPGRIRMVSVPGGAEVVMDIGREARGGQTWLTLELNTADARADLVFPARFLAYGDDLRIAGAQGAAFPADTLSLRSGGEGNTAVEVQGSERGLVLQIEPLDPAAVLLAEGEIQIPVDAVDFTRQGPSGEPSSSIIGPGTLGYPNLPAMTALALNAGEFVSLAGLEQARVESLGIGEAGSRVGIKLTLDTVASQVRVGTPEHPQDARLTWFDQLWHEPTLGTLFAIVVWFFTTTLAGYKLWQELRSSVASS